MDLLFNRYASPYLIVDEMISACRFYEFVTNLTESESNQKLWEFFLHKVKDGQSFNDWKASLETGERNDEVEQIETAINDSFDILNGFDLI